MEVLLYQAFIFATIALTRLFKKKYLLGVCVFWTLFTVVNLFYPPLIILQLFVVWGTYSWLGKKDAKVDILQKTAGEFKKPKTVLNSTTTRLFDTINSSESTKLEKRHHKPAATSVFDLLEPNGSQDSEGLIAAASKIDEIQKAHPSEPSFYKNYEQDPEVRSVIQEIKDSSGPILVTGKAGTGKSTLVKYVRDCGKFPNTVILAPTGIAAINVGGQTIHSFFRLPPRIFTPDILKDQRANKLWSKVELIIIDEISMVRADIMDGIDYILRRERDSTKPFGGTKMLFVGDFHQLPPVVPKHEKEMLDKMGYKSFFAYNAKVFGIIELTKFILQTVHRQSEAKFLKILSKIRNSANPQTALELLNAECHHEHRPDAIPLLLTGTNAAASRHNTKGLNAIDEPVETYMGAIKGKFNIVKAKLPAPERLELKIGARVMALKNDVSKQWVNGSLGTVSALSKDTVSVMFDHLDDLSEVKRVDWENIKYEWDEIAKKPVSTVIGSYTQIPLNLAWAVTIHKAQGLTLDDVRVDLEGGAFASGQAYVALSRARTLAGLSLARRLTPADIIVERRHKEFLRPESVGLQKETDIPRLETEVEESLSRLVEQRLYNSKDGLIPIFEIDSFDSELSNEIITTFRQSLEISYSDMQNNMTLRDVRSNFILQISDSGQNYLVGHCGLRNERRAFRIDRIKRLYNVDKDKYVTKDIEDYLLNLRDQ